MFNQFHGTPRLLSNLKVLDFFQHQSSHKARQATNAVELKLTYHWKVTPWLNSERGTSLWVVSKCSALLFVDNMIKERIPSDIKSILCGSTKKSSRWIMARLSILVSLWGIKLFKILCRPNDNYIYSHFKVNFSIFLFLNYKCWTNFVRTLAISSHF